MSKLAAERSKLAAMTGLGSGTDIYADIAGTLSIVHRIM
jgi:hypothetical protein